MAVRVGINGFGRIRGPVYKAIRVADFVHYTASNGL